MFRYNKGARMLKKLGSVMATVLWVALAISGAFLLTLIGLGILVVAK